MKKSTVQLSNTVIKNNLERWFQEANIEEIRSGKSWYKDAQDFCNELAGTYQIEPYISATVVSCLSPNNKWSRNKIDAENVIKAFQRGDKPIDIKVCTYNANKERAFRALDGELISEKSPKTHAFAMNVGNLSADHITIDKWHLRACFCRPSDKPQTDKYAESCSPVQYRRIEAITAKLAKDFGFKGYEMQAIIWLTIKRVWNR